jgi:hypothetical protein
VWDNNVLPEVGDSEKHQTAGNAGDFQNILERMLDQIFLPGHFPRAFESPI